MGRIGRFVSLIVLGGLGVTHEVGSDSRSLNRPSLL